jgi:multiple antibiotic resistance protein
MPGPLEPLKDFYLVFLPLLVAMDPLSVLPFLVPFLGSIPRDRRRRVVNVSLLTGMGVGLFFLGLGRFVFIVLGIETSDFLIAGGAILMVLSLRELLSSTSVQAPIAQSELMAVVPIGTPLLVGPATISLLILYSGLYAPWLAVAAFLLCMVVAWVVFAQSQRIIGFLGQGGLQAFSKVSYLVLAAIAVQLIRRGVVEILGSLE